MEGHSIVPSVIWIAVLIVLSGFFSATETAFTSLNRIRIKNKADSGDKKAKRVLVLENNYDTLLSTILVGNNLVNIAMTAVSTVLFIRLYHSYGPTISTIVTTVLVLIFGEITPKSLAKENPEKFAMFAAPLVNSLRVILTPINWIFSQWKRLISIIFKTSRDRTISEDELVTIVDEAFVTGGIGEQENRLIQNAIGFAELEAQDILTPRVDIEAIEIDTPIEEVSQLFQESGFSRLPVYEDDLDKIVGIIAQKDFYNHVYYGDKDVAAIVRPIIYVAGSMRAADLLRKLQDNKCLMAIIVDEYGGTAGLVTVEDIVEELVGEIYDESDSFEDMEMTLVQDGSYRILGSANVEKMFDFFGEEPEIDATTVNGWAAIQLDKLPSIGDKFEYEIGSKRFKAVVTKADGRKAVELNVIVEYLGNANEEEV